MDLKLFLNTNILESCWKYWSKD